MAEDENSNLADGDRSTTPRPDPTVLTTKQLLREIANTKEILETKLQGFQDIIETRLDGMDKAIELLQTANDKIPLHVDEVVENLQRIHEEKFRSIEVQFAERDTRTEQTTQSSKVAVDAALQAAKEAVGEQNKSNALSISKSEAAFTKQIDQIGTLIQTTNAATNDKIDDIKTRLTTIEGKTLGSSISTDRSTTAFSQVMTGVVALVVILTAIISVVIFLSSKST